jgi:peroxiredoxin
MTHGCTIEAHNFQRDLDQYTAKHAAIIGVSADTTDSHQQFCTKESLTFRLLVGGSEKRGHFGAGWRECPVDRRKVATPSSKP